MALVPSGKRRTMVAQKYDSPMTQGDENSVDYGDVSSEDVQGLLPPDQEGELDTISDDEGLEVEELGEQDLTEEDQVIDKDTYEGDSNPIKYIMSFLSNELGYPLRRLQEFKNEFVKEEGQAGGPSQFTITLPDQIYGKEEQIPKSYLKKLVQGLESKFGLSFQKYSRSGLKLILEFVSNEGNSQEQEDEGPGDVLDQVYGRPEGQSSGSTKEAQTIHELIKNSKSNLHSTLLQALGDKNASESR